MNRSKLCTLELLESRKLLTGSLAGQLDPDFGVSGTAETILQSQNAKLDAVAAQGDSTIVAATVPGAAAGQFTIEVFGLKHDGSLDTTFGQSGFARIDRSSISFSGGNAVVNPFDDVR